MSNLSKKPKKPSFKSISLNLINNYLEHASLQALREELTNRGYAVITIAKANKSRAAEARDRTARVKAIRAKLAETAKAKVAKAIKTATAKHIEVMESTAIALGKEELETQGYVVLHENELDADTRIVAATDVVINPAIWKELAMLIAKGNIRRVFQYMETIRPDLTNTEAMLRITDLYRQNSTLHQAKHDEHIK